MGVVKIKPHENGSLEALDSTLQMLPSGGKLRRNGLGEVEQDVDGYVFCECQAPGFVAFAVVAQGYAQDATETHDTGDDDGKP